MNEFHTELKSLGVSANNNSAEYIAAGAVKDPASLLERFPSPSASSDHNPSSALLTLNIETSEFTSLCPMTGQPDFATIEIEYTPDKSCVESKSLKLYFLAFRNRKDFHETCVVKICNDLVALLDPIDLKVVGKFTPRGGIPFWPTMHYKRG